jgi:predicted peptidase
MPRHSLPAMFCIASSVVAVVTVLIAAQTAAAADPRDRYEPRVYEDGQGGKLLYRLLKPMDYKPQEKYPLVLFLHGAGERGDDNKKQLIHGMGDFASDAIMEKYPCFVVAPQCPSGQQWVNVPWSDDSHTMPKEPSESLRLALTLVDSLQKEFSIDAGRLYVTGLSMGGFGTWDAIQRRPDLFAAAVPICGGGDTTQAKAIAQVPVWAFHGDKDTAVKTQRSRDMIAALKAAGGSPKYTEFPGVGHNSWSATYADPKMYEWLFEQRLKKR